MRSELDNFDMVSRFVVQKDLLLPQESKSQLYQCHFDFKTSSTSMFDKMIVKDSAFIRINKDAEYLFLNSNLTVLPMFEHLFVEVSFDVRCADTTKPLPLLVIRFGDNYVQQSLLSSSNEALNTGRWEHFHTKAFLNVNDVTTLEALKIYLWNKDKVAYDIDNLVIDVSSTMRLCCNNHPRGHNRRGSVFFVA